MAEALAEYWHQRIRQELGIAGDDAADMEDLFDQGYRGSRYSFGYPACPTSRSRPVRPPGFSPSGSGSSSPRSSSSTPSSPPRPSSCASSGGQVLQREVNPWPAGSEQLFVSRLARLPVRAPTGETIGRIADVVIARRESKGAAAGAGVHRDGAAAADLSRGRAGSGAGREQGATLSTGTVNLRPFQQREGETLVIGELLDSRVVQRETGKQLRLNDVAIGRVREEWVVTAWTSWSRAGGCGRGGGPSTCGCPGSRWPGSNRPSRPSGGWPPWPTCARPTWPPPSRPCRPGPAGGGGRAGRRPAGRAMEELPEELRRSCWPGWARSEAADILEAMEPDDAADLLGELSEAERARLLALMVPDGPSRSGGCWSTTRRRPAG